MDNERSRDDEQPQEQHGGDESVEEFKQEVEEDPSTATSPDEGAEQLRGG
jgi:hypothetical protein